MRHGVGSGGYWALLPCALLCVIANWQLAWAYRPHTMLCVKANLWPWGGFYGRIGDYSLHFTLSGLAVKANACFCHIGVSLASSGGSY